MPSKKRLVLLVAQVSIVCVCGYGAYYLTHLFVTVFYAQRDLLASPQPATASCQRIVPADFSDIEGAMNRIACDQTASFIIEHMPSKRMTPGRLLLLDHAVESVGSTKGMYCEFGVAAGESINYIANKTPCTIHGFDSFEGNPEDWLPTIQKGAFAQPALPKVRPNVKLYKGWFSDTLPGWAKDNPGPIAFMHMDADLYSSTKTVFDILGDRIVPGTIIQFDEYFNYPGWQQGEHKAFREFVKSRQVEYEYLGYSVQQLCVRILRIGKETAKGTNAVLHKPVTR